MAMEMADILFVLICMANREGIDLQEAFDRMMAKVEGRDAERWTRETGVGAHRGAPLLPFLRLGSGLRQQHPVALQPVGLDRARRHRRLIAQPGSLTWRQSWKRHSPMQRAELREAAGQLPRLEPPQPHLAESRRIHQVPAHRAAASRAETVVFLPRLTLWLSSPGAEREARLERVEQARLPRAGGAGHDRSRPGHRAPRSASRPSPVLALVRNTW